MDGGLEAPVDADSRKRLFLVVLTDLDEKSKERLVQALQEATRAPIDFEIWTPSTQLLGSVAKQGLHRDSQANIYAVANLSHRKGWDHLLIVDNLSKRQLNQQALQREDQKLSLVQVRVQQVPQELLVFVQRVKIQSGQGQPPWIDAPEDISKLTLPWIGRTTPVLVWEEGIMLRDPDRRVFEARTAASLAWEEYRKSQIQAMVDCQPKLPFEIAAQITLLSDYGASPSPIQMPVWRTRPSDSHRVIFLLFPATTQQISHMESLIHEFIQRNHSKHGDISVELINQDRHRITSRRDLMAFWDEFQLWNPNIGEVLPMTLHFIRGPFCDVASARCGSVMCTEDTPVVLLRVPFSHIIMEPVAIEFPKADGSHENLCSPNEPFGPNFPRWDGYFFDNDWMPLFSITNRLTDQQKADLRREIVIMGDASRAISPGVPDYGSASWKCGKAGEIDGAGTDIWGIVQEVVGTEGFEENLIFGCLDAESAVDSTVLIVKPDIYGGMEEPPDIRLPRLRGFAYARVFARRALSYKRALYLSQVEIEDLEAADGWHHRYKRPDWPENMDE